MEAELATLAAGVHTGPLYLRLGRAGDPKVHGGAAAFLDRSRHRGAETATDCALISTGGILPVAVAAAAAVGKRGHRMPRGQHAHGEAAR